MQLVTQQNPQTELGEREREIVRESKREKE